MKLESLWITPGLDEEHIDKLRDLYIKHIDQHTLIFDRSLYNLRKSAVFNNHQGNLGICLAFSHISDEIKPFGGEISKRIFISISLEDPDIEIYKADPFYRMARVEFCIYEKNTIITRSTIR